MVEAARSVVRVLDTNGNTVGVGVLVGPREILTCAHVVNAALGRDRRAEVQPLGEVVVKFVMGDGLPLRAQVDCWWPPPRSGATGDDIAGLVLTSPALPTGIGPARLAANPPEPAQVVDVFGYPREPPRPSGTWVEATVRGRVGDRLLHLDSTLDSALRIQPGFSGSPVYDRSTGRVVGLLAIAPPAASGERDSYAGHSRRSAVAGLAEDLRSATGSGHARGVSELVVLHVSDLQFGRDRLFGGNGLISADQANDIMFGQLSDDLDRLALDQGLRPDLMVVTGDLVERGPTHRVQPGDAVSHRAERGREPAPTARGRGPGQPRRQPEMPAKPASYGNGRTSARPVAPYWPKWEHFAAAFEQFVPGCQRGGASPRTSRGHCSRCPISR